MTGRAAITQFLIACNAGSQAHKALPEVAPCSRPVNYHVPRTAWCKQVTALTGFLIQMIFCPFSHNDRTLFTFASNHDMTSSYRARTGTQSKFNLLHPHPVAYDFANQGADELKIIVPPYSAWTCSTHWHDTVQACETLTAYEGHFYIFLYYLSPRGASGSVNGVGKGPAGFEMTIAPGQAVRWDKNLHMETAGETLVFSLRGNAKAHNFYRQLCSVNQDAETYFRLSSTPLWLRILYQALGWAPYIGAWMRAWLVERLLWVQLRVIYAENDYLEDEGHIPYTWPWCLLPFPPSFYDILLDMEYRSRIRISKLVQKTFHLLGTSVFGMKASYDEYEMVDGASEGWSDPKKSLL